MEDNKKSEDIKVEDTKNKDVDKEKNNKLKLLIFSILGLLIIIAIIFFYKGNIQRAKDAFNNEIQAQQAQSNNQEEQNENDQGEVSVQQEYSLIDMGNTENAKVENNKKENTSEALLKEKTIDGFKVSDIKLYSQDGVTYFKATVKNETGTNYSAKPITVTFKNNNGDQYAVLETYIGDIAKDGENHINASTTQDIANAYDFTISFI